MLVRKVSSSWPFLLTRSCLANALIERQRISLVEAHKNGCPWKTRQCDRTSFQPRSPSMSTSDYSPVASIYCIPLQSPTVMVRDVKAAAMSLNAVLEDVTIKHPLVRLRPK